MSDCMCSFGHVGTTCADMWLVDMVTLLKDSNGDGDGTFNG